MALEVINWNIAENILWFVRLADTGTEISVELYLSAADAQSQTSRQASGASTGYGQSLEIVLTPDGNASISFFQESYTWHLIVSGDNGDGIKIFKVREFIELDEIAHPIYRTGAIIEARANAEINAHTHAKIIRNMPLGKHLPELEPGDIVRVQSSRRPLDEYGQVFEHRIIGTKDSLTSEVEAITFLGLKR